MRAILIDPFTREITEVEHNDDFRQIYEFIGADAFDAATLEDRQVIYVDDEGLFRDDQKFWSIERRVLAGKGLVLGVNAAGESIAAVGSIEEWRERIRWRKLKFVKMHTTEQSGGGVFRINSIPVFDVLPGDDD